MGDNNAANFLITDTISDEELVRRLRDEFDFACGPVTGSTRGVYMKKLEKLVREREANDKNGYVDDSPSQNTKSRSPARRSSPRRRTRNNLPQLQESESVTPRSTPSTRRQSALTPKPQSKLTPSVSKTRKSLAAVSVSGPSGSLAAYSSESSGDEAFNGADPPVEVRKSPRRRTQTPRPADKTWQKVPSSRLSAYPSVSNHSPTSSPLARPPLRRTTIATPQNAKLANYSDSEGDSNDENICMRLLKHRPINNANSIVSQTNSPPSFVDDVYSSSSNWISFTILTLVVLFFVFIFSFYFYSRINSFHKTTNLSDSRFSDIEVKLNIPFCASGMFARNTDCLQYESDKNPALRTLLEIKNLVETGLFGHFCSDQRLTNVEDAFKFSVEELKDEVRKRISISSEERRDLLEEHLNEEEIYKRDFKNALLIINLNPELQIGCARDPYGEFSQLVVKDDYPVYLSFKCRIWNALTKVFWQAVIAAFTIVTVYAVYTYVLYKKRVVSEEQEQVMELVEKSIELLQSPDNPQSMPVLHIRDTLLSMSERKNSKYNRIWDKVVKFIEAKESRVKVELENIDGEDYKTWKWVATNNTNDVPGSAATPVLRTGSIEWQGQAFGEINSERSSISSGQSINGPKPFSFTAPTAYLKIRNMFDNDTPHEDGDWKLRIRNAILEKTSQTYNRPHGIVHIEIEENSNEGLVYLKCNSIQAATDAFNALHGWWCQKKLISVKFLKEERYYQRYPAARLCSTPLEVENI